MENKYYTPDISEFHIGFEYEWKPKDEDDYGYVKDKYCIQDQFDEMYINNEIDFRVKYLTKEDIESLGFEQQSLQYQYKKNWYRLINRCEENQYIIEDGRYQDQIFVGTIKNKSELKRLLKQLNIQ